MKEPLETNDIFSYEIGYKDGFDKGIKAVMQRLKCIENCKELKEFTDAYWEEEDDDSDQ